MLNKENRINKKKDYNNIYKKGKKILGRYMVLFIIKGEGSKNRYGFVTSKKIGNAVSRNRAKRRIRMVVKGNMKYVQDRFDVIIVARKSINEVSYSDLNRDYLSAMRKAGIC